MNTPAKILASALLVMMLNGFAEKPVEIMPEADSCASCRMSVDNLSLASELILADGDVKKFDELGCMVNYVKASRLQREKVKALFVHDFWTRKWLPLEAATLVKSRFRTPMGHGILAFDSLDGAKRLDPKHGGKPIHWEELVRGK